MTNRIKQILVMIKWVLLSTAKEKERNTDKSQGTMISVIILIEQETITEIRF